MIRQAPRPYNTARRNNLAALNIYEYRKGCVRTALLRPLGSYVTEFKPSSPYAQPYHEKSFLTQDAANCDVAWRLIESRLGKDSRIKRVGGQAPRFPDRAGPGGKFACQGRQRPNLIMITPELTHSRLAATTKHTVSVISLPFPRLSHTVPRSARCFPPPPPAGLSEA